MNKLVNKILVTKSFLPPIEEYKNMIEQIWGNNWLTNNGPLHDEFADELSNYLQVSNCTLFTNGHLALETALKALDLTGEVITTPFTFASTTHAIVNCGLTPIFCDIELNTYTMDAKRIEELITEKTSAIIPVHVFGNPCDVNAIEKIANKYNLKVLYDAAHVFGVEINGKGIGNFGDVAMFSLHATKVFNSIEGGVLTYNKNEYKDVFYKLKNFGITGPETVESIGINAKMNEFQAAMGLVNLRYVDNEIIKRKKIAECYRENLKGICGIKYIEDIQNVRHNYAYFPIIVNEEEFGMTRDNLHEKLQEYNVFGRKYFYPLTVDFECYKGQFECEIPNARFVSDRVLTLPMYGSLEIGDANMICKFIQYIFKNQ